MAPTGTVAAELKALRVEGSFSDLLVYRDRNRNRKLDDSDELLTARRSGTQAVRVALSDLIYPGYRRVGLNPNRSTQLFGLYDYVSAPLPYTYLLKADCGRDPERRTRLYQRGYREARISTGNSPAVSCPDTIRVVLLGGSSNRMSETTSRRR